MCHISSQCSFFLRDLLYLVYLALLIAATIVSQKDFSGYYVEEYQVSNTLPVKVSNRLFAEFVAAKPEGRKTALGGFSVFLAYVTCVCVFLWSEVGWGEGGNPWSRMFFNLFPGCLALQMLKK